MAAPPPPMYAMNSYFRDLTVDLPTTMYKMDNYYPDAKILTSAPAGSSSSSASSNSRLARLEARQQGILESLRGLTSKVESIAVACGVSTTKAKLASASSAHSAASGASSGQAAGATNLPLDLAITTQPDSPPLAAVLAAVNLEHANGLVVRQMWHSTLPLPADFRAKHPFNVEKSSTRISIIWGDEAVTKTVVSAASHAPILGDANAARFLLLNSSSPLYPTDALQATLIDGWVDLANSINSSAKEQKIVLKNVNATLGSNKYLQGDTLSLADIAMWAAIINNVKEKLPANIQEWVTRINENHGGDKALTLTTL